MNTDRFHATQLFKQMLLKPITAGIENSDDAQQDHRPTVILNLMALTLIALVIGVGSYLYSLKPSVYFVFGMPLEILGFIGVIWLNHKKKYFRANLLMLSVNAVFIAYWSTVLGAGISVELLLTFIAVITFHLASAFILHKRSRSLITGVIACIIIAVWMITNSYYHFIEPLSLSNNVALTMRWATSTAVVIFILAVLFSYVTQINNLLAEARKLQDVSDRKSMFLQDTFHEVRTPMNAIFSITQGLVLRKNNYSDADKKDIGILYDSCNMSRNIINHVLDKARIDSGKFYEVKKEAISLRDCISRCIAIHRYSAASRGIHIELTFDDALNAPVQGDKLILNKIFNNLISNAVKFANGNTCVYLDCKKAGDQIVCSVTNQGTIDPEIAGRLFERFVTKREQSNASSGLGLAITKHLVELLEGSIYLEPVDNPYVVTLGFSLPYEPGQGKVNGASVLEFRKNCYLGAKVLVIEDDQMAAEYLKRFLIEMGVETVICTEGRAAQEYIRRHNPHLIVCDLHMPDFTCKELLAYIDNDPQFKGTPVIVVSGDAFEKEEMLKCGACSFIAKPVSVQELHEELGNNLPYAMLW